MRIQSVKISLIQSASLMALMMSDLSINHCFNSQPTDLLLIAFHASCSSLFCQSLLFQHIYSSRVVAERVS
uniref:Uncharacterized protein n=1 Tax=Arion vulgaris TaxID=1028688 RepID=A0A0B7BIE1_9EUPU